MVRITPEAMEGKSGVSNQRGIAVPRPVSAVVVGPQLPCARQTFAGGLHGHRPLLAQMHMHARSRPAAINWKLSWDQRQNNTVSNL